MGTLPLLDETKKSSDGINFKFTAFTTTSDMSNPEDGCVWIDVEGAGKSYGLTICFADYDDRWLNRFVSAFCFDKTFRQQFERSEDRIGHPTISVSIDGLELEIDEAIAPAIVALNKHGARTAYCCQGGGGGTPYITLSEGRFPSELIAAWEGAGFRVGLSSVFADAPFGLSASKQFVQSLCDWLAGCLDVTGKAYTLNESRPNSLPKLPAVPNVGVAKEIARLVKLGKKAKFKDFAAVRSGRDRFSSMKYPDLVALCDAKRLAPAMEVEDESVRASILRWHLRGLPIDMAVHKVKVDLEISANVRQKRR